MSIKDIFREGMQESKRRSALSKEKKGLKDKEKIYNEQLTALGKKAWESNTGIDVNADLKEKLTATQDQLTQLNSQLEDLQKQKLEKEDLKKQENMKFDSNRKEVEEKKKGVDSLLNEEKNALKNVQKESELASNRLSQIPKEREQINKKLSDPATQEQDKGLLQAKLNNLSQEEQSIQLKYHEKTEELRNLNVKIAPLQEESNQIQMQINEILADQKKVIGELDKEISELKKSIDATNVKSKEADTIQKENFKQFGILLASSGNGDAAIETEMSAVKATEKEMSDIGTSIGSLEGQANTTGASAYKKMMMIIIGGVIVIILIIVALVLILKPKDTPEERLKNLFGGSSSESGDSMSSEDALKNFQQAMGGMKEQSEKIQGKKIVIADENTLKSVLPNVGGWTAESPRYLAGKFGDLETSHIEATYTGSNENQVDVKVSDAGTASAMLAPIRMLYSMNITLDDENTHQKVSTYNGTSVIERFEKQSKQASFTFIVKDRYIVELETTGDNGLEVLKQFLPQLNLSNLQ